jgi:hypothetical protein
MIIRQWIGDLAFAIVLALPVAALTHPVAASHQTRSPATTQLASAERISVLS